MFDFFLHPEFWTYVAVGFAAQLVDGALGMAFGTLSTAILLSTGLPPLIVSASVHSVQFFTTGISAISHSYFKNVHRHLFIYLAVAGCVGGVIGAMLLTHIDAAVIKIWVQIYLLCLGILIFWKLFRKPVLSSADTSKNATMNKPGFIGGLGFVGGFLDALGGGWGPMMTTTLIVRGEDPRLVVGSVNTAEFFVKTAIAGAFIVSIGFQFHDVVLGLLAGGIIAAPFGAFILRFIKPQILMLLVGFLITGISLYMLWPAMLKFLI